MPEPIQWYMDEHVPVAVTEGLRRRGIGVLTVQDLSRSGFSDEAHVALAQNNGFVIFTQDADFLRIAAAGRAHAGIVYAHQGTPIGEVLRGLLLITEIYSAQEMVNRIEYLS